MSLVEIIRKSNRTAWEFYRWMTGRPAPPPEPGPPPPPKPEEPASQGP